MKPDNNPILARKAPKAYVFDLDGTLIDSAVDIASAANRVLQKFGADSLSTSQVQSMVGGGARLLMQRAFAARGITPPGPDVLMAEFMNHYHRGPGQKTKPYPGIIALLDTLRRRGTRLAITTNKPRAATEAVLENLGWSDRFDTVLAADDLPRKKPDPLPLLVAAETMNVVPEDCLYIGDTWVDIAAARAAGMRSVAVTFGYSQKPPSTLGADHVVNCARSLLPRRA